MRFPEFTDDWEKHPTTDYFEFKNGLNPDAKRFGSGTKFISVMDILNNRYITYDKIIASVKPKENDLKEFGVNYGDILFQRSSETLEDVGRANVYLDKETALFGGFVIRGKKIGEYNPLFFRYLLSSPHVRKRIVVKGAGAQHFNIGQDGLSKVALFVPSAKEQEQIANLLNLVDERIETQIRIIDKLESLIRGLEQQLLKPKENWRTCTISDVLTIGSGKDYKHLSAGDIPVYGTGGYMLSVSDYLYDGDSVCIGRKGTIDKPLFMKGKFWTVDTLFYTFGFRDILPRYCFFLFQTINWQKYNEASGVPSLSKDTIERIRIALPNIDEQKRICLILDSIAEKVVIERSIQDQLVKEKNYLLRAMFA